MIISAFSGAGKTHLASKYRGVIDLESMNYHWIYPEELENLHPEAKKKNNNRKANPDWPDNYIRDILQYNAEEKLVLINGADWLVRYLRRRGYRCLNVYPDVSQKEEYLSRYRNRGNNEEYIRFWDLHFEEYIQKKTKGEDDIVMKPGEYLEDVLKSFL